MNGKHAWRSWLAHGAYVSKVEGSSPSGCIFHLFHNGIDEKYIHSNILDITLQSSIL